MILSQAQASELGEALLDAAEAANKSNKTQSVVMLSDTAVAVPYDQDIQDQYETAVIIQV
jgi:hypothetical protein|tara:strand:+ start:392 stop:571 length:180 start_codon:yes stop_codon:yes gene_type:complete